VPWEAGVGCGRIWGGGAGFLRLRHWQASLDLGIGLVREFFSPEQDSSRTNHVDKTLHE
jgi:hypothetical protein